MKINLFSILVVYKKSQIKNSILMEISDERFSFLRKIKVFAILL